MMIIYLKHHRIDKVKWDSCIKNSFNTLPYAYSWYLDIVSPGWDALVYNDYEAIMPLTGRRKSGISYICQPVMCQQLGVFSTKHTGRFCIDNFIEAIPHKYKLIDIAVNSKNFISEKIHPDSSMLRLNQELRLNESYDSIRRKYKTSHVRNIEKFIHEQHGIQIREGSIQDFIRLRSDWLLRKGIIISGFDQKAYSDLLIYLAAEKKTEVRFGYDTNQTVVGGLCLMYLKERVFILTFADPLGKEYGLIFYLMDDLIRRNSGRNLILDFMGSSIPGIRYRNMGFGCEEQNFTFISVNRLPGVIMTARNLARYLQRQINMVVSNLKRSAIF